MKLATLHDKLESESANLAERRAAAEQEHAAAKAEYDAWLAPQRRYRRAIAVMESLSSDTTAERAEAELLKAFAPYVEGPKKKLAAELNRTTNAYVRAQEKLLEERIQAILAASQHLATIHLDRSITDPEQAVREFLDNLRLPLLPSDKF